MMIVQVRILSNDVLDNSLRQFFFIRILVEDRVTTGAEKAENRPFLENGLERLDFNMFFSVQSGKAGKVAYICKTLVYCLKFSASV